MLDQVLGAHPPSIVCTIRQVNFSIFPRLLTQLTEVLILFETFQPSTFLFFVGEGSSIGNKNNGVYTKTQSEGMAYNGVYIKMVFIWYFGISSVPILKKNGSFTFDALM